MPRACLLPDGPVRDKAVMADTCYYKGTKILLVLRRNARGKWACQFTIPGLTAPPAGKYEGHPPKEYETELEAETAAFERSKKILDASHQGTGESGFLRKQHG